MVIAGLIEEQDNDNNTKVPLLGDIPILGYLFKNIDRKKVQKEFNDIYYPTYSGNK